MRKSENENVRITNRKARHDYHILETMEAGIELKGTEVKSLREAKGNLNDSFATIDKGEVWLNNFHINTYEFGNRFNHDTLRLKKLLLHRREIFKLASKVNQKGFTIVPLELYFNKRGKAKVQIAIAKGKQLFDKREDLKKHAEDRDIAREFRGKGLTKFL